jgi:hypothetical protein
MTIGKRVGSWTITEPLGGGGQGVTYGAPAPVAAHGKSPRTARGEKTLRRILEAARAEFGTRGFSDSSIVGITTRAQVALGTFYPFFDSKDALFSALVRDLSPIACAMPSR